MKSHNFTEPISLEMPTEREKHLSDLLDQHLINSEFFEDDISAIQREKVLGKLDILVKELVKKISKELGLEKSGGAKIFTFGSYRLGVHGKKADIDALCVVPKQITRKHFFNDFHKILEEQQGIKNLWKIEDAYVPLIKFEFHEIPIDLTFASLQVKEINEEIDLLDDNILKNMDDKCILSVNGNRVTDEILNLVPNTKVFHKALRCIKYWAMRRKIYGQSYGYFGGVAYAISVAKVCQLFPNACSFTIVFKFFKMLSKFKWPSPILIKKIEQNELGFRTWDPVNNMADKFHRMPVITPAYPAMCSTHNIFLSTQFWLTKEFQRGYKIISDSLEKDDWLNELFSPSDFFKQFKNFVVVFCVFDDLSDFDRLMGFIESRIKHLCTKVEEVEEVTHSIPFPKIFHLFGEEDSPSKQRYSLSKYKRVTGIFIGLDFTGVKLMLHNKKVMIGPVIEDFVKSLMEAEKNVVIRSIGRNEVNELIRGAFK